MRKQPIPGSRYTIREVSSISTVSPLPAPTTEPELVPDSPPVAARARASREEIAAWLLIGAALLLVIYRDLTAALVAGLVFYLLLDAAASTLARWISGRALRPVAVLVGTIVGGTAVTGAIALLLAIVRAQIQSIPALLGRMAEILQSTQLWLGEFSGSMIAPEAVRDAEDLKQIVVSWLQEHSGSLGKLGEGFSIALIHIFMALLLAAMVFLRHARTRVESEGVDASRRPLARHLKEKVGRFTAAFAQVVSAQVKISAINTTLTAIYLLAILPPILGRRLPFSMTMIFITFVAGLIPVVGNLISNTVIVIVSLGAGMWVAVGSLAFLVLIHKAEYVINSKIVGAKTGSQIWEILMAILIGEAAFGLQGIILGPVIYTFVKRELREKAMI